VDPLLVRGLDYYTRTTFEYAGLGLESAQNALGGGGRYDGLVAALGGPDTPGVGFALGVERILLALDAEGAGARGGSDLDVYIVDIAGGGSARQLSHLLRSAGVRVDRAFDGRSLKSQFRSADRSGARLALVIGPDELASETVGVKDLGSPDPQVTVARDSVLAEVRRRLT